ncbi:MAG: hypothetical protein OEO77_05125 [Acidimicrobiia bacterium]|nr:hypothetical protein [Acidimicrobiia bacterium]
MRRVHVVAALLVVSCTSSATTTTSPPVATTVATPLTSAPTTTTTVPARATTSTVPVELDLPDGWLLLDHSAGGFLIGVPPGWEEVDMRAGDFEAIAEGLGEQSSIADVLRSQSALLETAELFAFDATATGFATNMNILEFPAAGLTVEDLALGLPAQLAVVGATVETVDVVMVGGAEAVRIRYSLPGEQVGLLNDLAGGAFYVVVDGRGWAITYSSEDPGRVSGEFEAIAATFVPVR